MHVVELPFECFHGDHRPHDYAILHWGPWYRDNLSCSLPGLVQQHRLRRRSTSALDHSVLVNLLGWGHRSSYNVARDLGILTR